jgi:hypothetical protein
MSSLEEDIEESSVEARGNVQSFYFFFLMNSLIKTKVRLLRRKGISESFQQTICRSSLLKK